MTVTASTTMMVPDTTCPKLQDEVSMRLSFVYNIDEVYFLDPSKIEGRRIFEEKVTEICTSLDAQVLNFEELTPGMICAAQYLDSWSRACICRIDNSLINIQYIDHGEMGEVDVSMLKRLPDELVCQPPFVIKCQLKDDDSYLKGLSVKEKELFCQYLWEQCGGITESKCSCRFEPTAFEDTFAVTIRLTNSNENAINDFRRFLLEQNDAKATVLAQAETDTTKGDSYDFSIDNFDVDSYIAGFETPNESHVLGSCDMEAVFNGTLPYECSSDDHELTPMEKKQQERKEKDRKRRKQAKKERNIRNGSAPKSHHRRPNGGFAGWVPLVATSAEASEQSVNEGAGTVSLDDSSVANLLSQSLLSHTPKEPIGVEFQPPSELSTSSVAKPASVFASIQPPPQLFALPSVTANASRSTCAQGTVTRLSESATIVKRFSSVSLCGLDTFHVDKDLLHSKHEATDLEARLSNDGSSLVTQLGICSNVATRVPQEQARFICDLDDVLEGRVALDSITDSEDEKGRKKIAKKKKQEQLSREQSERNFRESKARVSSWLDRPDNAAHLPSSAAVSTASPDVAYASVMMSMQSSHRDLCPTICSSRLQHRMASTSRNGSPAISLSSFRSATSANVVVSTPTYMRRAPCQKLTSFPDVVAPSMYRPYVVHVSYVRSPNEFYVQSIGNQQLVQMLNARIVNRIARCPQPLPGQLTGGTPLFARNKKGEWLRARELLSDCQHVVVQFVDYGNEEKCSYDQLRLITDQSFAVSPQCLQVKLDGISADSAERWKEQFYELINRCNMEGGGRFMCQYRTVCVQPFHCQLFDLTSDCDLVDVLRDCDKKDCRTIA